VRRIEGGGDAVNYDLWFLSKYAGALGVEFGDLFDPDGDDPVATDADPGDVEAVGAMLATADGRSAIDALAGALDWSLEHTRLALDGLTTTLEPAGLRLVGAADTEVLLTPRPGFEERPPEPVRRSIDYFE
jgi:hypothetical protein